MRPPSSLRSTLGSSPLTRGKLASPTSPARRQRLIPAHAEKTTSRGGPRAGGAAHPRSRGENDLLEVVQAGRGGSSPLTRGKRLLVGVEAQGRGLIPAHAGKTLRSKMRSRSPPAHPRSRGENAALNSSLAIVSGSSPLTRGKPWSTGRRTRWVGLIPAHAGKTACGICHIRGMGAHPRSRGENAVQKVEDGSDEGSSPLTRGKPLRAQALHGAAGLIPAHAGKTRCARGATVACPAHPRSRGENQKKATGAPGPTGSSPLTRGKRVAPPAPPISPGLIPAHAGKTSSACGVDSGSRAHPRSRGENVDWVYNSVTGVGSSPLTRGKLLRGASRQDGRGLIPAHAGKTVPDWEHKALPGAHPRSRGENALADMGAYTGNGSSPLTRGKQQQRGRDNLDARLIPAHAGKTDSVEREAREVEAHPRSRGENGHGRREHLRPRGSSPLTRGKPPGGGQPPPRPGAHPRSRGENTCWPSTRSISRGSSPLTRGKLELGHLADQLAGLIPAHAGKTHDVRREQNQLRAHPRSRGENTS